MKYAFYNTIIGDIGICYENETILSLKKTDINKTILNEKNNFTDNVHKQLVDYLNGNITTFNLNLAPKGTDFQKKVWNELCNIPYGETRSYKEIAKLIGNKNACRAVGMANNKNPIHIIIPCHRVIGSNGKLVGYAGGIDMKHYLLDLETNNKSKI